ncbi:MAG: serine/threonine-protein kinase [Anaerovoracaceae bacterium]
MIDLNKCLDLEENSLEKVLSEKEDSAILLMRHPDETLFILRIYSREISAYRVVTNNNCPGLPQVYSCENKDGMFFVKEEYIDGISLDEMLQGGQVMEEADVKKIVLDVCRTISFIHNLGYIHRDIKPEHILMTPENRIVLVDLDASMELRHEKHNDTQLLGTAGYAAPEQFGFTRSDERTDIYAIGILINELLTGAHPTVKFYSNGGALKHIIEKCTNINPENRYQTILEIINELQVSDGSKNKSKKHLIISLVIVAILVFGGTVLALNLPNDSDNGSDTGNDKSTVAMVEETDFMQLYWGDGSTLYKNCRQGSQSAPLFTADGTQIDKTYDVHTDKAIGRVLWDAKWTSWRLSSNESLPGDTGLIYAEKNGKKYAMRCRVYAEPVSVYAQIPDENDLAKGYLVPKENNQNGVVEMPYNKGKDLTLYLAAAPGFNMAKVTCDSDSTTIEPATGGDNYPYPMSKLTIKNPDSNNNIFTVYGEYNQITIKLIES